MSKTVFRILAMCLTFSLLISTPAFTTPANAAEIIASGECGDEGNNVTWKLGNKGTLTFSGSGWLPSFNQPWNDHKDQVKSVVIESGITGIGMWAFSGFENLVSVTLADGLISIGDNAFEKCKNLTQINIPKSVTNMGGQAFLGCSKLAAIDIPEGVTSIGSEMCKDCTSLTQIEIPKSVESIGYGAFSGCTALRKVVISEGVTRIGQQAFSGCTALDSIVIPEGITHLDWGTFDGCSNLKYITFPESLLYIYDGFSGCDNLIYTTDDGASYIGDAENPFFYLKSVKNTEISSFDISDSTKFVESYAFSGASQLETIIIPDGVRILADYAFKDCNRLTEIVIPGSVEYIGEETFRGCTSLKKVTISEGVDQIADSAFMDCDNLVFNTKNNGKYLGNAANPFLYLAEVDDSQISEFAVADTCRIISGNAFVNCGNLASIYIPDSVVYIPEYTFSKCNGITNFYVEKDNKNYCTDNKGVLFTKDMPLLLRAPVTLSGSYTVPSGVKEIAAKAFSGCCQITNLTIPENVNKIGSAALWGCSGLKSLTIPFVGDSSASADAGEYFYPSVDWPFGYIFGGGPYHEGQYNGGTIIQQKFADYNSGYVTPIEYCIPDNLARVTVTSEPFNGWAFINCSNICEVVLGENVNGVAISAFENCGSLRSIVISKNVKSISWSAFNGCTSLTDVYYTGSEDEWKSIEIGGNNDPLLNATIHYNYVLEDAPGDSGDKATVEGANRAFGGNRYDTAFKAADLLKEQLGVEKFEAIVVADGLNFADALSGSYLAAVKNAPILLVRNNKTTMQQVKDYIKANLKSGGTVYLLGGVNAVPKAMESGLEGFAVKRLGGNTRYDTNLLILKEAGVGDKDILVCTGKGFADSLSASAAERPILLVKDSFTSAQKDFLKDAKGKLYIIGGTSAVSAKVETALKAYGEVKHLGGNTRYETSVLVAQEFFHKPTAIVLAYAQNFPDGLSGGALAAGINAPLILTASGKDGAAAKYAKNLGIKDGFVLGGPTLINDKAVKNIFSADTVK